MNPIDKITATLDFNNANIKYEDQEYQVIYASQLYGTFFAIYAKFKTIDHTTHYTLEKSDLFLLNYKGVVDLGIVKAEFYEPKDGNGTTIPGGVFKIEVQAMYKSKSQDLEVKNIDKSAKFNKNGSFLYVDRRLKRMHPQDGKNQIALVSGVFDTEFYYREGFIDNTNDIALKIGGSLKPDEWHDTPKPQSIGLGKPKCPRSQMKIL